MHFSCLVQDIHQAAPPWCSTASVPLSKPSLLSRFSSNVESGLLHRFVRIRNRTIPPSTREDQRTARFLLDSSVILRFLFLSFRDDQFRGGGWIFFSSCPFCLSLNLLFSITRFPRHGSRHRIPLLFVWTLLTRSSIARFYRDTRFCRVRGMINWIETRKFCSR